MKVLFTEGSLPFVSYSVAAEVVSTLKKSSRVWYLVLCPLCCLFSLSLSRVRLLFAAPAAAAAASTTLGMPCKVLPALLLVLPFCFCLLSCLFSFGGAALKGNKTKIKTSRGNKQTERKKERSILCLVFDRTSNFCAFLSFFIVFLFCLAERASLLCVS